MFVSKPGKDGGSSTEWGMDAISDRGYRMRKYLKIRNNMFLGRAGDLIKRLFNKYFLTTKCQELLQMLDS